jgi:hypothetical protein
MSAYTNPYRLMPFCGADDACMVHSYIEHVGCRPWWYSFLSAFIVGLSSSGRSLSFIFLVCRTPLVDIVAWSIYLLRFSPARRSYPFSCSFC